MLAVRKIEWTGCAWFREDVTSGLTASLQKQLLRSEKEPHPVQRARTVPIEAENVNTDRKGGTAGGVLGVDQSPRIEYLVFIR